VVQLKNKAKRSYTTARTYIDSQNSEWMLGFSAAAVVLFLLFWGLMVYSYNRGTWDNEKADGGDWTGYVICLIVLPLLFAAGALWTCLCYRKVVNREREAGVLQVEVKVDLEEKMN
jgi:hypothetical protein